MKLEANQVFPSDRVKSAAFHPEKDQVFASTHTGQVLVWSLKDGALVHSLDLCPPEQSDSSSEAADVKHRAVRALVVVPRQNWLVCGTDKGEIHVLDLNTLELVRKFKGHEDFIRCVVAHPEKPLLISSGDDKRIKVWDWSADWTCARDLSGHDHYVMSVAMNPEFTNQIASTSLDKTVKLWDVCTSEKGSELLSTLEGHEKGVNTAAYYVTRGGDSRLLLASASDDQSIKVWDAQSGHCLATRPAHQRNVSCVAPHPTLPVLLSAGEDEKVKVWREASLTKEEPPVDEIDLGQGRVWAISFDSRSTKIAFGCDRGLVVAEYK